MAQSILVFGDSHSAFFRESVATPKTRYLKRGTELTVLPQNAASVAGFRTGKTTLNTKGTIEAVLQRAGGRQTIVLAFGQVDVELGLYYRMCVKQEALNPTEFLQSVVSDYINFATSLARRHKVVIKGVNPTVMRVGPLNPRLIGMSVTKEIQVPSLRREIMDRISKIDVRPNIVAKRSTDFNAFLSKAAHEAGLPYFDLMGELGDPVARGQCRWDLVPVRLDIHMVDSFLLRDVHLEALRRVEMM